MDCARSFSSGDSTPRDSLLLASALAAEISSGLVILRKLRDVSSGTTGGCSTPVASLVNLPPSPRRPTVIVEPGTAARSETLSGPNRDGGASNGLIGAGSPGLRGVARRPAPFVMSKYM